MPLSAIHGLRGISAILAVSSHPVSRVLSPSVTTSKRKNRMFKSRFASALDHAVSSFYGGGTEGLRLVFIRTYTPYVLYAPCLTPDQAAIEPPSSRVH